MESKAPILASVAPGRCRREDINMTTPDRLFMAVLLLTLSALCWSTAGLFTRLIALDPWTILFWRGVFAMVLTGACALCMNPRNPAVVFRFRRAHWSILFWMTLGTLAFIPALDLTSVANVAVMQATTPLIVAGLSWVWLGERVRGFTLVAGVLAAGGVAVMSSSDSFGSSEVGLVLAFLLAFSMAMTTVAFRRHRDAACWPIACVSNALTASVAALPAHPFAVGTADLAYLMLFSLVQMTLGLGLFVMGTRRIPAADAAMIGLIEAPFAPLWVWLAFDEMPSGRTIIGGALVLAAASGHLLLGRGRCRTARAGTSSQQTVVP